jgi:hypothetical protein
MLASRYTTFLLGMLVLAACEGAPTGLTWDPQPPSMEDWPHGNEANVGWHGVVSSSSPGYLCSHVSIGLWYAPDDAGWGGTYTDFSGDYRIQFPQRTCKQVEGDLYLRVAHGSNTWHEVDPVPVECESQRVDFVLDLKTD